MMYQIAHAFLQASGNRIIGIRDTPCSPFEGRPTIVTHIYHTNILSVILQELGKRGQCGVGIDFFHQAIFVVDGLQNVL